MSEQTYRERWRREVYRTPLVTDSVRVALLALADDMDDDGMVSVDRAELAEKLSRSDRRIGDRFAEAIGAGFLERVKRGQRNGKGVYRATLPGRPSSGHPGVPKNPGVFRTPGGPEENSLQDGLQVEETSGLQDTRGSRRGEFDPSFFRTPGGPEEAAPYKGTARAHSKTADVDTTTAEADDSRRGGVVVALFDEIEKPSLRSHTAELRSAARAGAREADAFDEFWAAYPRRVGKGAARKAWAKATKKAAPEEIIAGARRYAADPRRQSADIRYTAHPSTWLNAERWTDEIEPAPTAPAGDPHQQAANDWMNRALARARARDAQENR